MEEEYSRTDLVTALYVAMSVSSVYPSCCGECFSYLNRRVCVYLDVVNVCDVCECWI